MGLVALQLMVFSRCLARHDRTQRATVWCGGPEPHEAVLVQVPRIFHREGVSRWNDEVVEAPGGDVSAKGRVPGVQHAPSTGFHGPALEAVLERALGYRHLGPDTSLSRPSSIVHHRAMVSVLCWLME